MTKKPHLLALAAMLCVLTGCSAATVPDEESSKAEEPFSLSDLTAGSDFYGYMNAEELLNMTLEESVNSTGSFAMVAKAVDERVTELIREIADGSGYAAGTNEQLIRDLYHLAADTNSGKLDSDAADTETLDALIASVYAAGSMRELIQVWGDLAKKIGFQDQPVSLGVGADPDDPTRNFISLNTFAGLGDLEAVTNYDYKAADFRDDLKEQLALTGIDRDEAKKRATNIVLMMMEIGSVTDFKLMDDPDIEKLYHRYTLDKLRTDTVSFEDICTMYGIEDYALDAVSIEQPEQYFKLVSLMDDAHLTEWQDETVCALLSTFAQVLPEKYKQSRQSVRIKDEDFADSTVKMLLGKEVGEVYAAAECSEKTVAEVTKLCKDIIAEYKVLVRDCDWLSGEGKKCMLEKLDQMRLFVGAGEPHKVDPADAKLIGGSLMETSIRFAQRQMKEMLEGLTKPAEQDGFAAMPPNVVNACYIPEMNAFNITAAICHAPFFDPDADYYRNLGGIGTVIGHEISHGFDNMGMKYDAKGGLRADWIPQADRDAFKALQDRVVEYYNTFKVLDSFPVKGRKTLGENLADLSGVQCALAIAKTPEHQKTVFEQYSHVWEELILDSDAKEQLKGDVHAPAMVRCNAVVACFDEFYEIYGVTESDPMYVAPEDRVRRW